MFNNIRVRLMVILEDTFSFKMFMKKKLDIW